MNAQMCRGIIGKQTKGIAGIAQPLLFRNHNDSHFGTMMLRVVLLQIDKTYAVSVGSFKNETKLAVVEKVVSTLGDILLEGIVLERHGSLSELPQLSIVLDEIHQVEVFGLYRSQFQLVTL